MLISVLGCKKVDKEVVDAGADMKTEPRISVPETKPQKEKQASICEGTKGEVIYEYLPDIELPEHLFTIIFRCDHDSLSGKIFGPVPAEEHGLYFFRADLEKVKADSSKIAFEFVQGDVFTTQITLNNYKDKFDGQGGGSSDARLTYTGTNYGDSLVFHCASEFYDCYADDMTFVRKK
ncbi:hypothetical protein SAMN04488109_4397 [Chryseolinea serpens]|uniref:Uncharacterized protein n=2 Tax=Chryseolinea serpens TaxID=947013 RepID=A0A1M5U0Z9_9BACT|nr:hypothetical protein SAMN04488109_4397 [Chryseolinea serpens]